MNKTCLTYIHIIVVFWLKVSPAKIKIISIPDDGGNLAVATCTQVTPQNLSVHPQTPVWIMSRAILVRLVGVLAKHCVCSTSVLYGEVSQQLA